MSSPALPHRKRLTWQQSVSARSLTANTFFEEPRGRQNNLRFVAMREWHRAARDLDGRGCRDVLVYCELLWYNHSAVMNANALADEMPVFMPRMVCTVCGLIGADVRPNWSPVTNRRPW
jgi:hypothetical protein